MGSKGFIADTVMSLVTNSLFLRYPERQTPVLIAVYFLVAYGIFAAIYWVCRCIKSRRDSATTSVDIARGTVLMSLLVGAAIAIIAQHAFFGINYVTDRAALFFIPLIFLSFPYTFSTFRKPWVYGAGALTGTMFCWLTYNFFFHVNISHTMLWWFDADDLHVLERINKQTQGRPGKLNIHTYWIFGPSFYYDIHHFYPDKYDVINWDKQPVVGADTSYDYYYVANSDNVDTLKLHYHQDTTYVWGGFILYRKN
jgi:hypothetical protein